MLRTSEALVCLYVEKEVTFRAVPGRKLSTFRVGSALPRVSPESEGEEGGSKKGKACRTKCPLNTRFFHCGLNSSSYPKALAPD